MNFTFLKQLMNIFEQKTLKFSENIKNCLKTPVFLIFLQCHAGFGRHSLQKFNIRFKLHMNISPNTDSIHVKRADTCQFP